MHNKDNNTKDNKLEFNTYCIFTKEKQSLEERIGLIFEDYIRKSLLSESKAFEQQMPHTSCGQI